MHRSSALILVCTLLPLVGGCPEPGESLEATTVEVRIPADGFELEGTLHLPDRFSNQPVPSVVLMHGSGPQSRDVTVTGNYPNASFTLSVFLDIAEALNAEGYAVLRYDKRSCTSASGSCDNEYPNDLSPFVTDFLSDAEAAVAWLASHEAIAPDRIVPVGHSQGASFGPHMLRDNEELPAAVMLAGPFRPVDELLAWQLENRQSLLREAGYSEEQIISGTRDIVDLVESCQAVRDGTASSSGVPQTMQDFWQSWFDVGDVVPEVVTGLDRPILAISGDYDWNVPSADTEAWGALFSSFAGGPAHEAVVLPCVTHSLNCVSEPNWLALTQEDVEQNVSEELLLQLLAFLNRATE